MKRIRIILALTFITALVLSACTIDITATVNPDGSGALGMIYKLTADDLNTFESMGMPSEEICTSVSEESGEDMTLSQEKHGDEIWCIAEKEVATLEELKAEIEGDGFTINALELDNDQFVFDADVDMTTEDTGGLDFGLIEINFSMTAPGKVTDHNGDSIDGNTVTWNMPLGSKKLMYMESKVGSSGLNLPGTDNGIPWVPVLMLCCCCVVMIILVIAVGVIIWRMNQGVKAGEPIPSSEGDIVITDPNKIAEGSDFDRPGADFGSEVEDDRHEIRDES